MQQKKIDLIKELSENKIFARHYYLLKEAEYQYAHNEEYKFDQFCSMIKEIGKLKVSKTILKKFQKSIQSGSDTETCRKIMRDLAAGQPPVHSNKRKIRFWAALERYPYAEQKADLNKLWRHELKYLLISSFTGEDPENLNNPKRFTENKYKKRKPSPAMFKYKKIAARLKFEEKADLSVLTAIAKDLRHSYMQKFEHLKEKKRMIGNCPDEEIIILYLKQFLSDTSSFRSWKKNFLNCIAALKKTNKKNFTDKQIIDTRLEMTLLDRQDDLFRYLRYPDAVNNCFNSDAKDYISGLEGMLDIIKYTYRLFQMRKPYLFIKKLMMASVFDFHLSPVKTIAVIYKNPLSFVADIKMIDSNKIIGFVFGNMAIKSASGRLILMISNVYVENDDPRLIKKVLEILEQSVGKYLKAEYLFLPKYSHYKNTVKGYYEANFVLTSLVAVRNEIGLPVQFVRDDYLNIVNQSYKFLGFCKKITRYNNNFYVKKQIADRKLNHDSFSILTGRLFAGMSYSVVSLIYMLYFILGFVILFILYRIGDMFFY